MSRHLKIVRDEPPKAPTKRPARRPYSADLITGDEQTKAKQALRNLHDAFGTWGALASAMRVPKSAIDLAMRLNRVTPAMMYAASKASGLSIAELLGAPIAAERCRACGQIKRRVA